MVETFSSLSLMMSLRYCTTLGLSNFTRVHKADITENISLVKNATVSEQVLGALHWLHTRMVQPYIFHNRVRTTMGTCFADT